MNITIKLALACLFATTFGSAAQAYTLVSGTSALDGVPVGGVRYRNLGNSGGDDMYLGVPDLGVGGNRVQTSAHSYVNNTSMAFSFNYDAGLDKLTSQIGGATLTYLNFLANATSIAGAPAVAQNWNAMEIKLLNRQSVNHSIALDDVLFNGGSLAANGTFVSGFNSEAIWQIQGYDFKTGFTLSGNLLISGPSAWSTSQELSRVNMAFGYDTDAVPEPATMAVLAAASLIGLRRRAKKA